MDMIPLSALTGKKASLTSSAIGEAKARQERAARWKDLRPSSVTLYLENGCNLRCQHCYETEESHPKQDHLLLADYERIFDELVEMGVLFLHFTGGEIFLNREAMDIFRAAKKRRFSMTIFTSGTLLNEKKIDALAEIAPRSVEISLYSHDPKVHDNFTQIPGSHAKSVRALRMLADRGITTVLKSNLMTFNGDHIDELIALAKELGADFQFDPTVKPRMNGNRDPLRFALSPDEIRRKVLNRPDLFAAFEKNTPDDYCHGDASLLANDSILCGAARGIISIGADGGVYACGFFPTEGGTLKNHSLKDIYYGSAQFDSIRQTTFDKMTACQSCDVKSTCKPCMAYGQVEHGDHRECATASHTLASAIALQSEMQLKNNAKMNHGRPLPLLNAQDFSRAPLPSGRPRLYTEP
jgi:radical SAM protein with 4Fe4S-binding SPASM domain